MYSQGLGHLTAMGRGGLGFLSAMGVGGRAFLPPWGEGRGGSTRGLSLDYTGILG